MARVHTSRGSIGFDERGGGDALPIVFLHGVGSDKSVWQPQLEHFSRQRRAVAFDQPGYDESDLLPRASRDEFATAILDAMSKLGIARAHVCGLSLGGVVALAMHAQAAERCATLILADSFARHPEGRAIYERSTSAAREQGLRRLAEARVDALLATGASEMVRSEVVETMARIDPAAYAIGAEAVWLADQRDRADAVRCPTLVLCGSEDRVTPPALSEDLKERIAGAALVEIAGAGHLSNLEQPAVFNRVVDAFLAGVEQG